MANDSRVTGTERSGDAEPPPIPAFGPRRSGVDLNPLSIWSVVLGIIWGFGVASLVAVVLGFMVLNRIDASEGRQKGRLLAAFGVLLGAAGVLITIVIGSMFAHDLSGI